MRTTANVTSGATPVRNNKDETKIKKRMAAEEIAIQPVIDARLRKKVIFSSLILTWFGCSAGMLSYSLINTAYSSLLEKISKICLEFGAVADLRIFDKQWW